MARRLVEVETKADQIGSQIDIDRQFPQSIDQVQDLLFLRPGKCDDNIVDCRRANIARDVIKCALHRIAGDQRFGKIVNENRGKTNESLPRPFHPADETFDMLPRTRDDDIARKDTSSRQSDDDIGKQQPRDKRCRKCGYRKRPQPETGQRFRNLEGESGATMKKNPVAKATTMLSILAIGRTIASKR